MLLRFDDGHTRTLRLRVRFTRSGLHPRQTRPLAGRRHVHAVLLLEDLRIVRARHRQDKLAAMGRMSAGIAHEIRNPLAAIAQANALLAEDAQQPDQHRLTRMVADNVERLKHIVDDILAVAPGARPPAPAIDPHRNGDGHLQRMARRRIGVRRKACSTGVSGCQSTSPSRRCACASNPSTCSACW